MSSYLTIQGDTWDLIAFRVYGDELRLHLLIKANPTYRTTVIFPAGIVLTVPDLPDDGRAPLPPWLQNGV